MLKCLQSNFSYYLKFLSNIHIICFAPKQACFFSDFLKFQAWISRIKLKFILKCSLKSHVQTFFSQIAFLETNSVHSHLSWVLTHLTSGCHIQCKQSSATFGTLEEMASNIAKSSSRRPNWTEREKLSLGVGNKASRWSPFSAKWEGRGGGGEKKTPKKKKQAGEGGAKPVFFFFFKKTLI